MTLNDAQRRDAQKLLALASELPAEQLARLLIYGEALAKAGRI